MKKIKVMIADNNPVLLQQLAETVGKDEGTEVVGVVNNGRDAYEILDDKEVHVAMFDLLLPYYDGFALLDKINQRGEEKKTFKVILTTPIADEGIAKEAYRKGVNYIMMKPYDVETVIDKIKRVCIFETKKDFGPWDNDMEAVISAKLNQVGIPASLNGYRYLITAVNEVLRDETVLEGVTKILYPEIAKKHNTTPQRVEKAIRHAIEVAWKRNGDDKLKKEFEYAMNSGKDRPTNSEFIAILGQNIKTSKQML